MTSDDSIALLTIIPLWTVVAFRAYSRYQRNKQGKPNPGQDALLWTFLTLAIGATLRLSPLEHLVTSLTGVHDGAVLPKHLSVMISCLLLVGWVDSAVPPRDPEPRWRRLAGTKPRLVFGAAAATAALITFGGAAPARIAPNGDTDFINGQYGDGLGTIYLMMYLVPIGVALALSAALCLAAATRNPPGAYRRCMQLMAIGCIIGTSYPLYRLVYLGYGLVGGDYPLNDDQFDMGGNLLQIATILPVLGGSSIRGIDLVARARRNRRALIRLRPMWGDLACVLGPDKIRSYLTEGTTPRADRWRLRNVYDRLDERIVDISDAAFELLPWIDEGLPARALAAARAQGHGGDCAEAAAVALCLRIARRRAVEGEDLAHPPTVDPLLELRDDQEANAAWLSRVSFFYSSDHLDEIEAVLNTEKATA
ncbi:MAB_1171c family putative transporter [Streptomyces lasiicapitis]|uniref:MAB_1171c family putative transporter n=1 Tax=Streptomyces lasiicapitis TaxID=1923961 RepID=UPI00332E6AB4